MSRIALFLPSLAGGGVASTFMQLARAFLERGHAVDLVLCKHEGDMVSRAPAGVNLVVLDAEPSWRARARILALEREQPGGSSDLLRPVLLAAKGAPPFPYLAALARYLVERRPAALFSAKTHTNLVAVWARELAGVATRVVVSERTQLSVQIAGPHGRRWRWRYIAPVVRRVYPRADGVVTVSRGVAEDLVSKIGLPAAVPTTVYNPVVTDALLAQAEAPLEHPWFRDGECPVVLAAGRLTEQKDFPTLLRAFAQLREKRRSQPLRLVILGEGKEGDRTALEALVAELGLQDHVDLPGFAQNPFKYMSRAALFVLSSAWEGLPGVLIQALACGAPVVSTDCPSGPREILEGGAFGPLVPVGDVQAMADAMAATLDEPPDRARLVKRGSEFSARRSVDAHLAILLASA